MTDLIFQHSDALDAMQRAMSVLVGVAGQMDPPVALPTRQLVSAAGAVYDCEQISVSALSIQTGFPEATGNAGTATWPPGTNQTLWTIRAEIAIVRQSHEQYIRGAAPIPTMIQQDLAVTSTDAALLINTAHELVRAVGAPVPHSVAFTQTQGGMAATTAQVTFPLWEF